MRENADWANTKDGELMMKNANTPANPTTAKVSNTGEAWSYQVGDDMLFQFPGLTKREMFAMAAMQGILSSLTDDSDMSPSELARCSVRNADALLAELEK